MAGSTVLAVVAEGFGPVAIAVPGFFVGVPEESAGSTVATVSVGCAVGGAVATGGAAAETMTTGAGVAGGVRKKIA